MTDKTNLGAHVQASRRIIAAREAIVPVDSQGIPTRAASVFTYDDNGLLVSATKGKALTAQDLRNAAAGILKQSVELDRESEAERTAREGMK